MVIYSRMANMALRTGLAKVQTGKTMLIARTQWSSRTFVGAASRPVRVTNTTHHGYATAKFDKAAGAAKKGASETMKAGHDARKQATSVAEDVAKKAKDAAEKGKDVAEELAGKAKETAEEAWDSINKNTRKIKENLSHVVDDAKEEFPEKIKKQAENFKKFLKDYK